MLSPDARRVAMELLRPPPGMQLDCAVITTYSLDLEALLALPLAVLAHAEGSVEELLADPLLALEGLREARERIHVFVDEGGIAPPKSSRELYSLLEDCVHVVRAPNGGVFHPKLWLARFASDDEEPRLRIAVLSRNLTFDQSWDLGLVSETTALPKQRALPTKPLAELVTQLPALCIEDPPEEIAARVASLADEVSRCRFPAPERFEDPVHFHALGLGKVDRLWGPDLDGLRVLAMAPFVTQEGLDTVLERSRDKGVLVSRAEELDRFPEESLEDWDPIYVLQDAATGEEDDEHLATRLSGLHAKAIALEHGFRVTWYVGSANLTTAALSGRNVELMASIEGRKGRAGSEKGEGIEPFLDAGFRDLCVPYVRTERDPEDMAVVTARAALDEAKRLLLHSSMSLRCREERDQWLLTFETDAPPLPDGVRSNIWPLSIDEGQGMALSRAAGNSWRLPAERLAAFLGFRLSVTGVAIDDTLFVRKLPISGLPDGRMARVLRSLISSPERFLQFLRALLGGLEEAASMIGEGGGGEGEWGDGLNADTLLEDLLRTASRDPSRLEPIRRLIADLSDTEDGREIVPAALRQIWDVVDSALAQRAEDAE